MRHILVPISYGELLDKIAILQIKSEQITCPTKLANIAKELSSLEDVWAAQAISDVDISAERVSLKSINEQLWDIEERLRIKEGKEEFDADFIKLARRVYLTNDERARIKRVINLALGSLYIEEKSYPCYEHKIAP